MFDKLRDFINEALTKPRGKDVQTQPQEEEVDSIEGYEIFDPGSTFDQQTSFIQKNKTSKEDYVPDPNAIDPSKVADASKGLNNSNPQTSDNTVNGQNGTTPQTVNININVNNNGADNPNSLQNENATTPTSNTSQVTGESDAASLEGLETTYDENGNPIVVGGPVQKVRKPKKKYRYTIINSIGKKENGTFDAENENDVRNFLLSQDYQVLSVKEREKWDIDIGNGTKMSAADLSFSLTQLSTYIKSGIPLSDSVKILAKQAKKASLKKSFNQLVYELLKGESFSEAMEMQPAIYPKLLINMVKTSEMTGDLPTILDDMAEYYTSMDQTKKQMRSAMTYPIVVLTLAFGVLIFMLTYLVPQFTQLYEDQGAELPALTKAIVAISAFIREKWYILIIVIVAFAVAFYYAYTRIQKFKETVQTILMHTPIISSIIIYNEVANFTKTFASLINHGVFITDSMEILSKITTNEIYKKIINKTLENLAKGETISAAFRGEWAIPIVAYEMIVTGESTGQLGTMMEKVATHFQMLHKTVIDQMKSLVEPLLICFLAVVVGVILVSIIQPMFGIYSQIK